MGSVGGRTEDKGPPGHKKTRRSYLLSQRPSPERLLPSTPSWAWEPDPVAVPRGPPPRGKHGGVKLLGPQQTTPILTC